MVRVSIMSLQSFIQLAIDNHNKTEKNDTGINQNKVKSEALEIFNALYDELIVLYLRNEKDREHFLTSFSKSLGEIFPIKTETTKKKSKSRKKMKTARDRFSENGMFYWKSKKFKELSSKEQDNWRKQRKEDYPWLAVSAEEEKMMKSNSPTYGIRFYTSKEFKKMSKSRQKEWGEQSGFPVTIY